MLKAIVYENEGQLVSAQKAHSYGPSTWYFFKNRERIAFPSLDEAIDFIRANKDKDFGVKKDGTPVETLKLIRQLTESDYKTLL